MTTPDTGRRRLEYRQWTLDEDERLRALWETHSPSEIAAELGRGASSIYNRVQKLGLKRPDSYKALTNQGRFRKGQQPWNAGKVGWQAGGRSAETRFKLGDRPSNTWRPIGSERTGRDGYTYRKVADTGVRKHDWRTLHHLEWVAHHGPIPDGCIVVFRDRNPANCHIDNLELIDRGAHMRRNGLDRYGPEIHSTAITLGWFKRKLKKLEATHENPE